MIHNEGYFPGNISFIFTDDDFLQEMNRRYLEHDYFTDVITFDLSVKKNILDGEIYISVDTVRENAKTYGGTGQTEILRVMVHGILHLAGYGDSNEDEKVVMRSRENFYIDKFKEDDF